MCATVRAQRLALALLMLIVCRGALAQDMMHAAGWNQISDSAGIMMFTAVLVVSIFILRISRRLRSEVSRRRQAEAGGSDEKAQLTAILNNARVGVMITDRQLRHVDANRRWCQMFGYRRAEARSILEVSRIAHPDDAQAMQAQYQALLNGEIKYHTREQRFVRRDGGVFWGLMSTSTVRGKAGQCKWVVGTITDIDAQKRIEVALRESKERLRFITENTHDVVWQLDSDFRFTYVNGADERMRGYQRDEVIGRTLKEIITPAGYQIVDQVMQRRRTMGGETTDISVESFEVEMRCKDGRRVWVEINSTPIRDQSGQITGYIGVTRDATQRREAHEKLLEQSIRDPLTGLFNRRHLDESLEHELARAKQDNLQLSLLMIDIDHFKRLNDTHGHPAGDEVIKRLAELIRHGARGGDLPCRYGGEEFLLVLPNMSLEAATQRAELWRSAFAGERIAFGDLLMSATLSAGVAAFPGHGSTRDELIEAADKALYTAKHSGRNCVVVAP